MTRSKAFLTSLPCFSILFWYSRSCLSFSHRSRISSLDFCSSFSFKTPPHHEHWDKTEAIKTLLQWGHFFISLVVCNCGGSGVGPSTGGTENLALQAGHSIVWPASWSGISNRWLQLEQGIFTWDAQISAFVIIYAMGIISVSYTHLTLPTKRIV